MTKKGFAKTLPMRVLEEKGIPFNAHQQAHKQFTAEDVARDLGVPVAQVVKAMLIQFAEPAQIALVVVPGDRRLSLKKMALVIGDKNVRLASQRDVERMTGFQLGAVSVVGFRKAGVPGFVDRHVLELDQVIISSGKPDVGLALKPDDMLRALDAARVGDFTEEG